MTTVYIASYATPDYCDPENLREQANETSIFDVAEPRFHSISLSYDDDFLSRVKDDASEEAWFSVNGEEAKAEIEWRVSKDWNPEGFQHIVGRVHGEGITPEDWILIVVRRVEVD